MKKRWIKKILDWVSWNLWENNILSQLVKKHRLTYTAQDIEIQEIDKKYVKLTDNMCEVYKMWVWRKVIEETETRENENENPDDILDKF